MRTTAQSELDLEQPGSASGLDWYGRFLLRYARAPWRLPGHRSAARKFRRRYFGRAFTVRTRHGFLLSGAVGDSVETACAIFREFEPGLSLLLASLAGKTASFVDVGCNVGYFTCLMAAGQPGARILAVDANPDVVSVCRRNLELNQLTASVVHAAVGEENRQTVLHVPQGRATRGTLGDASQLGQRVVSVAVEMKRFADLLDAHGFARVDLVKIDIEGYESRLFAGLDAATALRCELIIFELSLPNLAQCGCQLRDFEEIEWLKFFAVLELNPRTGRLRPCASLASVTQPEATVVLHRKEGERRLALEAWLDSP